MPDGSPAPSNRPPIKALVVDDHPALRDGLEGLLREENGFLCVGALPGPERLHEAIAKQRPEVVVVDYALHRGDGLSVCFRIKQLPNPPGVVLYSAYVDALFAVPATLAQADAIVSKTAPVDALLEALEAVARGERRIPPLLPETVTAASSRLPASELPIAGMLFSRVPLAQISQTLGIDVQNAYSRALRIIGELQASDRAVRAAPDPFARARG